MLQVWVTREAAPDFDFPHGLEVAFADAADLGRLIPRDAPHQGIVAEVERLPDLLLADVLHEAPRCWTRAGGSAKR